MGRLMAYQGVPGFQVWARTTGEICKAPEQRLALGHLAYKSWLGPGGNNTMVACEVHGTIGMCQACYRHPIGTDPGIPHRSFTHFTDWDSVRPSEVTQQKGEASS